MGQGVNGLGPGLFKMHAQSRTLQGGCELRKGHCASCSIP